MKPICVLLFHGAHCKDEYEIQGNGFQVIKEQSDCFMRKHLTGLLEHLLPKCGEPGQLSAPTKELGTVGPQTESHQESSRVSGKPTL